MKLKKYQMGGEMPQPQEEQGGAEEQLMMMAQEIIQQLGPEGAMMLAEAIAMLLQGSQEQPAPQAPAYARRGGKLVPIQ